MKVLWLAAFASPSEPSASALPWVLTLAQLVSQHPSVELTILNWARDLPEPVQEFDRDGIHFIYLRAPGTRPDILSLYQWRIALTTHYLRRHYREYDLIHIHGSELQYQVAAAGLDIPMLLSVQGLVSECAKLVPERVSMLKFLWTLAGYYECRYMPSVAHFSCRTHWDKAHVARLNPHGTIHHNWETIRAEFFAEPSETAPSPERPQVLFLGGKQLMKGFRETLAAFDLARQRQPDLKLIIGGRADLEDVQQVVRQAGLRHIGAQDVECRGYLSAAELTQLCHESLCLVHPSYIDNSPNTVCEAQVAGLPVIASNVGGVSSLVVDGETGLLSDLRPRTLADRILLLHDEAPLRQRLARQARAVAHERHNPATVLQTTLDIYQTLVS